MMKMKYKALMLDVDGTTVKNHKHSLPTEHVIQAVKKANKKLHIGLVTGRPYFLAKPIIDSLGLTGPSILSGGAQVVDVSTNAVLWEKQLSLDFISKIQELVPHSTILVTDGKVDLPYSPSVPLAYTLDAGIQQVLPTEAEKIISVISHFPEIVTHTVSSWEKGKVDVLINHVSATKQHGIFEVAKILKIDTHDIIGVGDGGNDMPLLMACGLKVAMGNANESLKAIAYYVAPTVDEDGVAHVIEKFILSEMSS